MQIQVNTDAHIEGDRSLVAEVEAALAAAFERFGDQVIRVEAYLSDTNSHKSGQRDIRCVVEARLSGLEPIAGTYEGQTIDQALSGAIDRVERQIDKTVERLGQRKGRTPFGGEPVV